MNERLEQLKALARSRESRVHREKLSEDLKEDPAFGALPPVKQISRCMRIACDAQKPLILPGERIVFTRTVDGLLGGGSARNICAAWDMALDQGLLGRRKVATAMRERLAGEAAAADFLDAAIETIDALLNLTRRYADQARSHGLKDVADVLDHVPACPPRTFREAIQSLKILHSATWLSGASHVTLGRFDQYMWPYLKADLDAGRITHREAEELLAELFISFNKDSDLYPGIQEGDNGQSIMLGGVTREGADAVNDLTWMVLRVSHDVNMIDPKINLRLTGNTDLGLLKEAARLTRRGLGFPQYANDDVEIDALVAAGYDLEDARDYTVAACWEFIIPGHGMDVPNINACSFPAAADEAIRQGLDAGESFPQILDRTRDNIRDQVHLYAEAARTRTTEPSPFYSVLMHGCLEKARDVTDGGVKYYNYGIHGAGSANAADALAAVKKFVFDDEVIDRRDLLDALDGNFQGYDDLFRTLHDHGPKVGNNDDRVDGVLVSLFDWFADACQDEGDNGRGGIFRAGTGSAMFYVYLVRARPGRLEPVVAATADGRRQGDFIASSLAPAPGASVRGPISILQSFSKIDYRRVCNGGPITMELSDTVFRDEESIEKVAMLIRTFARLGAQQLQINTLNVDRLKAAKKRPEQHRNLIVRVWGWSGYFVELDEPYQDHIISRHMLTV